MSSSEPEEATPSEHEQLWRDRMTLGLDHQTAIPEFARVVQQGSLPAQNPRGIHHKPVQVAFDLRGQAGDDDHILFKAIADTHGRQNKGLRLPQDFQQDRADRIGWIPYVLLQPDAIYADKKAPGNLAYICSTLPGEEFLILVHERETPKGACYFVTAYAMTSTEWGVKRQESFTKVFPAKSTGGKKGAGRIKPWRKK